MRKFIRTTVTLLIAATIFVGSANIAKASTITGYEKKEKIKTTLIGDIQTEAYDFIYSKKTSAAKKVKGSNGDSCVYIRKDRCAYVSLGASGSNEIHTSFSLSAGFASVSVDVPLGVKTNCVSTKSSVNVIETQKVSKTGNYVVKVKRQFRPVIRATRTRTRYWNPIKHEYEWKAWSDYKYVFNYIKPISTIATAEWDSKNN